MESQLLLEFKKHRDPSAAGVEFITQLETSIGQDLWGSAGGHWSQQSQELFRAKAMKILAQNVQGDSLSHYQQAWPLVVRDFHLNHWNETRLTRKEKKERTPEQKIFWELFSYIWMLLQAVFITKTAVFYFGIKSAQDEGSPEGKIYVILAIVFSFGSLFFFAFRKARKKSEGPS